MYELSPFPGVCGDDHRGSMSRATFGSSIAVNDIWHYSLSE